MSLPRYDHPFAPEKNENSYPIVSRWGTEKIDRSNLPTYASPSRWSQNITPIIVPDIILITRQLQSENRPANHVLWLSYLAKLSQPGSGFQPGHIDLVRNIWTFLCQQIDPHYPTPRAGPTSEGAIQLVWDKMQHHLTMDIDSAGTFEWFYKNRKTKELDGQEGVPLDNAHLFELSRYFKFFAPY